MIEEIRDRLAPTVSDAPDKTFRFPLAEVLRSMKDAGMLREVEIDGEVFWVLVPLRETGR